MSSSSSISIRGVMYRINLEDNIAILGLVVATATYVFSEWKDIGLMIVASSLIYLFFQILKKRGEYKDRDTPEPISNIDNKRISREDIIDDFDAVFKLSNQKACNRIIIITGKSGVGKSIAAHETLKESALKNYFINNEVSDLHIITEYNSFEDSVRNFLKKPDTKFNKIISEINKNTIFVLDQFESLFQSSLDGIEIKIAIIKDFFKQANENSYVKVFIVIREEWFTSLFIFRPYISWERQIIPIYGIIDNSPLCKKAISNIGDTSPFKVEKSLVINGLKTQDNNLIYLDRNRSAEAKQTIKPVEILIVRKSLDFLKKKNRMNPEVNKLFGGIYIESFINATENPLNSSRVLFCFSVVPQVRRRLSIRELSELTHLSYEDIKEIIKFFKRTGLIHDNHPKEKIEESEIRRYDWVHDHFAEIFHEISGTLLSPEDRDNISFFWYRLIKERENVGVRYNQIDPAPGRKSWSNTIFYISMTLLFVRILGNTIAWNTWEKPFSSIFISGFERIDFAFLFVALSLLFWALYIKWIYIRLLITIQEEAMSRFYSDILPLSSLACIVGSCIEPNYWLFFTGIGGLAVGTKYLQLSRSINSKQRLLYIFKPQSGWFRTAGWQTIAHCIFLCVIGYFYSLIFEPNSILANSSLEHIAIISIAIWGVMLYFAIGVSIRQHASKKIIPTLRGEYFRNQYR